MSTPNQLTAEMAALLARLAEEDAGLPDPTTLPYKEGRALAERANQRWNQNLPEMAEVSELQFSGAENARLLVPHNDGGKGAILYIHGGGFAFCSAATHERAARTLAIESKAPVVTFDYRLAPEHPFPAGLDDCAAAWEAFCELFPGRQLAVSGDSAGANLALSLMYKAAQERRRVPDLGLLFYGCFDCDFETPSYREHEFGPGLTRGKMMRYYDWYVPEAQRTEPLVSPLLASDACLAALPPLYLNAAGLDPLRSDTERLSARLTALGRVDRFVIVPGVVHGFMQMTQHLEAARGAFADAGRWFTEAVKR